MRIFDWIVGKRHYAYALSLAFAGGLLLIGSVAGSQTSAQSADSIYVAPASGTYNVGETITISIRENSSGPVNAVSASLSYTSNLEYISTDGSGSAFSIDASGSGGSGSVSIARGTITPVSGDQLVSRVNFKVVASGGASINMGDDSQVLSSATSENVVNVRNGASYTLKVGATTPAPSPSSSPSPVAAPTSSSKATTARAKSPATVTIAAQGSAQTTPLPGDSKVELNAPAIVETKPTSDKPVVKVEYMINDKVVGTDVTAPYGHSIDSDRMRNGTYTLTTKTYYQDGTVDTSNASFVVSNPLSLTQVLLQLRHYAWLVIIVLIIIGEFGYLAFFRRKGQSNTPFGPANGSDYNAGQGDSTANGMTASMAVAPNSIADSVWADSPDYKQPQS
jgi:hypothetical protein